MGLVGYLHSMEHRSQPLCPWLPTGDHLLMSSLRVGLPIPIPRGDLTGLGLALSHLVLMTSYSVVPPVTWL